MRDLIKKILREETEQEQKVLLYFERILKEKVYHHKPFKFSIVKVNFIMKVGRVIAYFTCTNAQEATKELTMDYGDGVVKLFDSRGRQMADLCNYEVEKAEWGNDEVLKKKLVRKAAYYASDEITHTIGKDIQDWGERLGYDDLGGRVNYI